MEMLELFTQAINLSCQLLENSRMLRKNVRPFGKSSGVRLQKLLMKLLRLLNTFANIPSLLLPELLLLVLKKPYQLKLLLLEVHAPQNSLTKPLM